MVYGFVKQSDGHIRIYSEVGHGTTIRLYLPRAPRGQAGGGAKPARRPAARHRHRERILVVEDNDAVRQIVLAPARASSATGRWRPPTARQRRSRCSTGGEAIDLLFTDVVMPGGMSGDALAAEALARRPGLKVLFTSGFPGALLSGIDCIPGRAMLGKPYRFQELAIKIRSVLEG